MSAWATTGGTPSSWSMDLLRLRRVFYIFLGLYAAALILLIPTKPLWLDEIIDLGGVRGADLHGVLDFVPRNAGVVPLAHLTWLIFTRSVQEKARAILLAGIALAVASLSFLPWFLKAHTAWQGAVNSGVRFLVTGKDLLVIPHELMGTGYAGAALTGI